MFGAHNPASGWFHESAGVGRPNPASGWFVSPGSDRDATIAAACDHAKPQAELLIDVALAVCHLPRAGLWPVESEQVKSRASAMLATSSFFRTGRAEKHATQDRRDSRRGDEFCIQDPQNSSVPCSLFNSPLVPCVMW